MGGKEFSSLQSLAGLHAIGSHPLTLGLACDVAADEDAKAVETRGQYEAAPLSSLEVGTRFPLGCIHICLAPVSFYNGRFFLLLFVFFFMCFCFFSRATEVLAQKYRLSDCFL